MAIAIALRAWAMLSGPEQPNAGPGLGVLPRLGPVKVASGTNSQFQREADVTTSPTPEADHLRFIKEYEHLARPFGAGGFGEKAEAFARFFGTPTFLIAQTLIVFGWILINSLSLVHFDLYPFILLNLMFSLQAAYAAPLILLAQTRQADRDKAQAEADAKHREAVSEDSIKRQQMAVDSIELLRRLLDENTQLTKRVEELTMEIHGKLVPGAQGAGR